jgi:hypothetical protein
MASFFGVLFAMLISVTAMSGLYAWSKIGFANVQAAVIANQGVVIGQAMNKYLNDTGTALAQIATPTTRATVTVDDVAKAGYLPKSVSMRNAYGQSWEMRVLQPFPGKLQAMLFTTGGRQMPPSVLVLSAAQMSAQGMLGGFVPYSKQFGDASMQPTVAVGANGTFRQALGSFANPDSGHLATMLGIANAQADNGFLYRVDMKPARPDLNAMQTDLSMTDTQGNAHDINGANTVNANKFQLPSGGGMNNDQGGALELGAGNGNAGTGVPYIDFHLGGKGVQDFNARLQNDGDNHLVVAGANGKGSLGVQGTLQAGNIAIPGSNCSPNGIIAANADGSGQMLSCQYGVWMPIGGRWLRYGYYTVADAWSVPAPTCPNGGAMKIQVTLQNFSVNDTTAVNSGPATWNGNGWTVHLTDGNGYGIPGAQGVAATYCAY